MSEEIKSQEAMDAIIKEGTAAAKQLAPPTGAACYKSVGGFASCGEGITKAAAEKLAKDTGVSVTFYEGKKCSEITCS